MFNVWVQRGIWPNALENIYSLIRGECLLVCTVLLYFKCLFNELKNPVI